MSRIERQVVDFRAKWPPPRSPRRICADPRSPDFAATQRKNSVDGGKTIKITCRSHCALQRNGRRAACERVTPGVEPS
jgi:hypothetical protein